VESPIELTYQDFGSVRSPVTWRTAGDGAVTIRGTKVLESARKGDSQVWSAPIETGQDVSGMYCDGQRMRPARYPSADPVDSWFDGWLLADAAPNGELANRRRFWSRDPGLARFESLIGAEIVVFAQANYRSDHRRIISYDPETGEIRLDRSATYDIGPGHRFYVQYVPDALDSPGEWRIDEPSASVEFIPFNDQEPLVELPVARHIFDIQGSERPIAEVSGDDWPYWDAVLRQVAPTDGVTVSHLTIRDLVCEGTSDAAIQIESCAAVTIQGCTIRNCGQRGIRLLSGESCRIADTEISHIASGGVLIAGGVRRPFTAVSEPANHVITNCYIHHTGLEEKHSAAVAIAGVGNTCEHCLIHDVPRWGIHSRGNHHRIEFNHIRHLIAETSETAGIFLCDRDWQYRGTAIRFNYVHDIPGTELEPGPDQYRPWAYGIYLDDWTSGVTIEGNIVSDTAHAGILINSGHSNLVTNNIVRDSTEELLLVQRWPSVFELERMGTEDQGFRRNSFLNNILVGREDERQVYTLEHLVPSEESRSQHGNSWYRNVVWKRGADVRLQINGQGTAGPMTWHEWRQESGQDLESVIGDPLIGDDWQLMPGSPAIDLGFEQIPFERIGILPSDHRPDWPPVEAAGVRESRLAHRR
jgi:parallel beta-helix repeat protein